MVLPALLLLSMATHETSFPMSPIGSSSPSIRTSTYANRITLHLPF
jgi:hypothetical protein